MVLNPYDCCLCAGDCREMLRVVEKKRMTKVIHGLRSQNINNVLIEQALFIFDLLGAQNKWNRLLRVFYIDAI